MYVPITRGKVKRAQKVVIYGPEGIGKSTFAAQFPDPLFIDTEGGTNSLDVNRVPRPSSWSILLEYVRYVKTRPDLCKTLVIDTADWAEQLCMVEICSKAHKEGIEDFGYGKGYVYLAEEFGRLLNLLEEVAEAGIHTVITAHAWMRKFEQPDELGSYDRWELKLQKKTAPLVMEWADMVLFANYKTIVVNVDNHGATKGKNKAQGGQRVMYTTHHPCWDAKNRHDLADELPFLYAEIAHCIPDMSGSPIQMQHPIEAPEPETTGPQAEERRPASPPPPPPEYKQTDQVSMIPDSQPRRTFTPGGATQSPPEGIPLALWDLMIANNVTVDEINKIVAFRGYYPADTPISNYDPQFVEGVLVGAWPQVFQMIQDNIRK